MTKEREKLELRIGWDLSSYSQEQIENALKMNDEDAIEYLIGEIKCEKNYLRKL